MPEAGDATTGRMVCGAGLGGACDGTDGAAATGAGAVMGGAAGGGCEKAGPPVPGVVIATPGRGTGSEERMPTGPAHEVSVKMLQIPNNPTDLIKPTHSHGAPLPVN